MLFNGFNRRHIIVIARIIFILINYSHGIAIYLSFEVGTKVRGTGSL
jgi:predicted transporter